MTGRVLIVDDEANLRRMLEAVLTDEGLEVQAVESAAAALAAIPVFEPDAALLDLVLGAGADGLALLEQIRARHPDVVAVMMSGKAMLADAVRATKLGAFQFLEKPVSTENLIVTTRAAVDLSRARAENRALKAALGSDEEAMIGSSRAIEGVRNLIAQVAPTSSRVLIVGESGTGKELVARSIHAQSPRAAKPLVSVNCAAVPRELLESELFGHEKGAFTGAVARREGKFQLAHGGTLFLDEVGDLELAAQAKLLRVLETETVERVGGTSPRRVDVRVIAATNRVLESEVAAHRYREDLFFRLNVFPIVVPPLMDRLDDLPVLVEHLASRAARRCNRPVRAFGEDALRRLGEHSWPGNVRELANLIERLTIVGQGPVTRAELDPVLGSSRASRASGGLEAARLSNDPSRSIGEALEVYERGLIESALAASRGNISEAARRLRTDRSNLHRRMRRLGIGRSDTNVSD